MLTQMAVVATGVALVLALALVLVLVLALVLAGAVVVLGAAGGPAVAALARGGRSRQAREQHLRRLCLVCAASLLVASAGAATVVRTGGTSTGFWTGLRRRLQYRRMGVRVPGPARGGVGGGSGQCRRGGGDGRVSLGDAHPGVCEWAFGVDRLLFEQWMDWQYSW